MKKRIVSKAKPKKINLKLIFAGLAVVLAVGGYALYRNSQEIPSINLADGLEAEEAAFLSKTIKTTTPAAPAPQIKVTTKNTAGQEVTKTVSVARVQKAAKDETEMKKLKAEIAQTGIVVNKDNVVIKNETYIAPTSDENAGSGLPSSSATCQTLGAPVAYGTWVSTGEANGNKIDGVEGRNCVMCGEKGYEGSMDCRDVIAQGKPIVLPTGGGLAYTGYKETMSSCIAKVNGIFMNVAVGRKADSGYCGPDGVVYSEADTKAKLASFCGRVLPNSIWDGSKCVAKIAEATGNSNANQGDKPCEGDGLVMTADGKCHSQAFLDAQNSAGSAISAEAAAKALAAKELALAIASQSYAGKADCDKAIFGRSTLECYATGPLNSQTYAVRTKTTTYIACPMVSESVKDVMVDLKKGCGTVPGSIAAAAAKNVKFVSGALIGGETTKKLTDCRFGGTPSRGAGLSTEFICNDYTGKTPTTTTDETTTTTTTPVQNNSAPSSVQAVLVETGKGNNKEFVKYAPNGKRYDDSYCTNSSECLEGSYCKPYNFINNPKSHCEPIVNSSSNQSQDTGNEEAKVKKTGDTCSNGLVFNTCKLCPGAISMSSTLNGKNIMYYCGNTTEIDSLVNGKLPTATLASYKFEKPQNLEETWVSFPSGNQPVYISEDGKYYNDSYCNDNSQCASQYCKMSFGIEPSCQEKGETNNSVPIPTVIKNVELPSKGAQVVGRAATWGAVGGVVAGGICGLGVTIAGGGIGVAAAFPAYTVCAAWGASIGATVGGVSTYVNSQPDNPPQESGVSVYDPPVDISETWLRANETRTGRSEPIFENSDGKRYNTSYCDTPTECLSNNCVDHFCRD